MYWIKLEGGYTHWMEMEDNTPMTPSI